MFNKRDLRQASKKLRASLNMKSISLKVVDKLRALDEYKVANNVMIFYPLDFEIDLTPLLMDRKNFYLPRVSGEELLVCPYSVGDVLTASVFKVKEPISEPVNKGILDLVIVPALCVDKKCNRLGYGKGFYDRFLSEIDVVSIVVVPDELIFDKVFADDKDVACSKVVSPNYII